MSLICVISYCLCLRCLNWVFNVNVHFDESSAQLVRNSDACGIGTGTFRNGLYTLDCIKSHSEIIPHKPQVALVSTSLQLLHERLAHVNVPGIKSMVDRGVAKGINIAPSTSTDDNCVGCVLGKSLRAPIPKVEWVSNSRATKLLQLVHSDVSGPIEIQSIGGARYFVSFIDDYSKWTVVYFMQRKSKVLACFKLFRALVEKHTSATIGNLKCAGIS